MTKLCILILLILSGCSYSAKTNIFVEAKQVSFPRNPLKSIILKDGNMRFDRNSTVLFIKNKE